MYFVLKIRFSYLEIPIPISIKLGFALLTAALIFGAVGFCGDLFWRKTGIASLVFLIAWAVSTPVISLFQTDTTITPTLSVERILKHPPKAVVVIILDELSPEMAPIFMPGLDNAKHLIHVGTTLKAGKNTINAIPSMLKDKRHDDVVVCGYTMLCGENPFDMSQLKVNNTSTDIVGFYHPYCAIQGLRSCWKADNNPKKYPTPSITLNYLRLLISSLPIINTFFKINPNEESHNTNNSEYIYIRNSVTQHALTAPIWTEGGLLYIHQFLPHPVGNGTKRRLKEEYEGNLHKAAEFVSTLKHRLQNHFGADYALIITTDHPLRTKKWCSDSIFAEADCERENHAETGTIPFIVSAPKLLQVKIPSSNVGVFSPP